MNLLRDGMSQQSKGSAEGGEVGRGLGVEVREPPIDQVAAQLAFQIAEAPALHMLEHAATQQAIWGYALATGARRSRTPTGQTLADQLDQMRVIQELVHGLE